MNPQHAALLRAVAAGSITCTVDSSRRFYFDGSPVEPFATSVLNDLFHDELAEVAYGTYVQLTDAGRDALQRELAR